MTPAVMIGQTISKQVYGEPGIEGVQFVDLKRMVDDSGSFTELLRLGRDGLPEKCSTEGRQIRQVNFTTAIPGVIKAFHLHRLQWDIWFVPPTERVLIVLADIRQPDLPAERIHPGAVARSKIVRRYLMGDGTSRLLVIPPGVAHGYRNLMDRPATLFYMVTDWFTADIATHEEFRLPWNMFGEHVWEVAHG
jgi:dTDP-4-dehydrorhamnose 3,5-epimerase